MPPSVRADEGRLPDELAEALEPQLRHALDNPVRREILRVLHRDTKRPWSVKEIASDLSGFTVDNVHYHARVLEQSEAIVVADVGQALGDNRRLYVSGVAEDPRVLAALRATRQLGGGRARGVSPPQLLTMFRVPRPAITIRLGEHLRRSS